MSCGASSGGYDYYITLVGDEHTFILSAAFTYEHTGFHKTAAQLWTQCSSRKESVFREVNARQLRVQQTALKPYVKEMMDNEDAKQMDEESSSLDVTYSEEGTDSYDTSIAMPKSVQIQKGLLQLTPSVNQVMNPEPPAVVPAPIVVNPIQNNDNAHNVSEPIIVVNIDQTLMDEELIEALNEDPKISSLLEPGSQENNIDLIPPEILIESEKEVLKETVKEKIHDHHNRKSKRDEYEDQYQSFSAEGDYTSASFAKKMKREEDRYNSRKRTGKMHNGPYGMNANAKTEDNRYKTHDLRGQQMPVNKSFTKQDDDYLDYAFYGFIREYGTIVNDIMTLPLGYAFNSERRGSTVTIKAIHFRNTFTHVSGSKVTGRLILFYTSKEMSYTNIFGRHWTDVKTEDILQKSVTMYAGDLEEGDAIDLFYNPTVQSQYDFKNVILGTQFLVLYDYYSDMNTTAVKGVVGEDIESVDNIKTRWIKIDDLDLELFYDGDDKIATRGQLGVLFMGDYFGGEIETNLTLRVFYNSR
jgi:hypothetical protein